ncbi:MAG: dihydrolipoyl dehydrogenase [Chloroflexi bacterium]|uniref:Dihydrolipoyl dehydrogenase n=1 Tax=Candidatus Chlorohelix allophototropha TaxID=3003348 RepID=A0A8T7LV73_9CHLR|nr:dihydrolipoyl dehydrogenase [Chloroflexota bacterium]WJW67789.1 FAD-dependent oxidoreductase [Chloroflexota bacterium L227-S17]
MVVGDVTTAVDVVVLGGGPGGYVAAIRAAQLGKSVVLVEQSTVMGGVCLNEGCIPLKALVAASERYWQTLESESLASMGILTEGASLDFSRMQNWKDGIIHRLTEGVAKLLSGNRVEVVHGLGWFLNSKEMRVEGEHGALRFNFEQCVLAVGASYAALPDLPFDGKLVLNPRMALKLADIPPILAIWGDDYIALELATVFGRLGSHVALLTPAERPLPDVDASAVRLVMAGLRKLGIQHIGQAFPVAVENDNVVYLKGQTRTALPTGTPLVVCGNLQANTANLHLKEAGLSMGEGGAIEVAADQRTRVAHIFAAGDCTQHRPAVATSAIKQAKVAAEALAGKKVAYTPQAFPRVVGTSPELAVVGLSAEAAQAAGYRVKTGRFSLAANGRALTLGADSGVALLVADADNDALLGVTLVGTRSGDLIGEAALAIEMGATLTDLAETLHWHPGLGEMLLEGAESALGQVIHQLDLKAASR